MSMLRTICFLVCFFYAQLCLAQVDAKVLTLRDFYAQIFQYHPLAKQAKSLNDNAKQELRMARGSFDPKFSFDFQQKNFAEKDYYQTLYGKLKVPLWIGELQTSYENNSGEFLDPSESTDPSGLLAIGVGIPIGRGILIDERRNALRQAQIFQNIAEVEKIKILNKILLNAAKDYAQWCFAYQQYRLVQVGYQLAEDRYKAVKQRLMMGELAPIDSVQALITFQERDIMLQQSLIDWQNAGLILSNYMWADKDSPLEIAPQTTPQVFAINASLSQVSTLTELIGFALENHPEVRKNTFKRQQLTFEERFQTNNLMPNIMLNYNLLRNIDNKKSSTQFNLRDNYKLGLTFEMPLLLRKERSKLQIVRIKQNQIQWEIAQVKREVETEIRTSHNDLRTLDDQIKLLEKIVENYKILRDGEVRKFWAGESSLFLINAQESKYIESQIKLASLHAKYQKAQSILLWAAGKPLWE